MIEDNRPVVVYIPGFLSGGAPSPLTEKSALTVRTICVHPSSVCSIHDRVMQIFFELKGGTVNYGKAHSEFHGHDLLGETFHKGEFEEWGPSNPIHIVGHSYGGITALVLQSYLAKGSMFHGHSTNASWVRSVVTVDSPLNGCLMVYGLGANLITPPVVRWGSLGCMVGWLGHIWEFIDSKGLRSLYDFNFGHWGYSRRRKGSMLSLVQALLGHCFHSTTDNSSYDMTIQSQLAWSRSMQPLDSAFYLALAGTGFTQSPAVLRWVYSARRMLHRFPRAVAGVDTKWWLHEGFDGLLSVAAQSYPFLRKHQSDHASDIRDVSESSFRFSSQEDVRKMRGQCYGGTIGGTAGVERGVWHVRKTPLDHVAVVESTETWSFLLDAIHVFDKAPLSLKRDTDVRGGDGDGDDDDDSSLLRPSIDAHANAKSKTAWAPESNSEACARPDMQVPLWDEHQREILPFNAPELVRVSLVAATAVALDVLLVFTSPISHHPQQGQGPSKGVMAIPMAVGLVVGLMVSSCVSPLYGRGGNSRGVGLSADFCEVALALLRLLLLVALGDNSWRANVSQEGLWVGAVGPLPVAHANALLLCLEVVACASVISRRYHFTAPTSKALVAMLLNMSLVINSSAHFGPVSVSASGGAGGPPTSASHVALATSFLTLVASMDAMTIIAKTGRIVTSLHQHQWMRALEGGALWPLLWAFFLSSLVTTLGYCFSSVQFFPAVGGVAVLRLLLCLAVIAFAFQKMQDMSECFQIVMIFDKYKKI